MNTQNHPMKVIILAGGLGTRLAEETEVLPKPLVEIGGRPILWHIMKQYAHYGFKEFFVALGYKGEAIKRYFLDYYDLNSNLTIDLGNGNHQKKKKNGDDWILHLIDTGRDSFTGTRVKRLKPWLKNETFMVTYGDGVSNINLQELLKFHQRHGRIATISVVRPPSRFGGVIFEGDRVAAFTEKPQMGEGWINGGFIVFEPAIFDYLHGIHSSLESDALSRLARDNQLMAFKHDNFWQCMDTLRDKRLLERLWNEGDAPWRVWK